MEAILCPNSPEEGSCTVNKCIRGNCCKTQEHKIKKIPKSAKTQEYKIKDCKECKMQEYKSCSKCAVSFNCTNSKCT